MTETILETGRVSLSNTIGSGVTASVSFTNEFDQTPVIIAYVATFNGANSVKARAKDVTTTGCTVFFEENTTLDGNHGTEEVMWMAVAPGRHVVDGTVIEAGIHTTATTAADTDSSTAGDTVSFSQSFPSTPVILHGLNSHNSGDWKATTANTTSASDFHLAQEEGSNTGAPNATEDLAWVAFENVGAATMDGVVFEASYGDDGASDGVDESPHTINYTQSFGSAPDIVVSQMSRNGTEGGWARGAIAAPATSSTTSHSVYSEEDSFEEQGHTNEAFGWVAFPPGTVVTHPTGLIRREVTITEQSGTDLADYAVRLTFGAGDPIFDRAALDGSDIRIGRDGSTPHWIETYDPDTEEGALWVKVSSLPANGSTSINLYYGDGVAYPDDGAATFHFYDDFEAGDLSKWSGDTGGYTISSDSHTGLYSVNVTTDQSFIHPATGDVFSSGAFELTARVKDDMSDSTQPSHNGFYVDSDHTSRFPIEYQNNFGGGGASDEHKIYNASATSLQLGVESTTLGSQGTWYQLRLFYEPSTGYAEIEATNPDGSTLHSDSGTLTATGHRQWGLFGWVNAWKYDEIRARTRVRSEPTVSLGVEKPTVGKVLVAVAGVLQPNSSGVLNTK